MAILFPDIEKLIVEHLTSAVAVFDPSVRVGTIKSPAEAQPQYEVVVTAQYGETRNYVTQEASAVLEVYADTYGAATELGLLVAALIIQIPRTYVKRAVVTLGPVRLPEMSQQECRSLTVDFTVKGADL